MLQIDGSFGEGGGQILRTSLTMSLVTGKPVRIVKIRAGRKKPGLLRQHLTALEAAGSISGAEVTGGELGSRELTFTPHEVVPGDYHFSVGTAGSATLVLQTILPALWSAPGPSSLILEGGTHNPFAPPFDFLQESYLPLVSRMGPALSATLDRHGFYPAGGGRFRVSIHPCERLEPFDLVERGKLVEQRARALVARLPLHIAERELKRIREKLSWKKKWCKTVEVEHSRGPGNVALVELRSQNLTEVFTGFGKAGLPAPKVADQAVRAAREYLKAGVPVGKHLADQLLIPMALAGRGAFHTLSPSQHTLTNIEVLKRFLELDFQVEQVEEACWRIEVRGEWH